MRWSTSWCFYSRSEFLVILSSTFAIFQSTTCSPMREQRGSITALYLYTLGIDILVVIDKSIYILLI